MSQTPLLMQIGFPLVALFIVVELAYSHRAKDGKYTRADLLANLGISAVGNVLARFVWAAIAYAAYSWAYAYAPNQLPTAGVYAPLVWVAAVLVADFAWYWEHRAGHQIRLLWAIHSVHHSSQKFNYGIALRLPWLGGLSRIPFLMLMAFAGFHPAMILLSFSLVLLYQIWVHTEYVGKIGVLEEVLMTPSHHRVHHATQAQYLDKNYGGILILWDKLFGTLEREGERPIYGLTHQIDTHNPWKINTHGFRELASLVKAAPTMGDKLRYVFKGPDWSPAAARLDASPVPSEHAPRSPRIAL